MAHKKTIPNAPGAILSRAVISNGLAFLAGHVPQPAEKVDPNDITSQTHLTMEGIKDTLAACGCTLDDVVRVTIYLTDMADFQAMNAAYREYFPSDPPARTTIGVAGLAAPEFRIEIDIIAAIPE